MLHRIFLFIVVLAVILLVGCSGQETVESSPVEDYSIGKYSGIACQEEFVIAWQHAQVIFTKGQDVFDQAYQAGESSRSFTLENQQYTLELLEVHDTDFQAQQIFCTFDGSACGSETTWFLLDINGYEFVLYLNEAKEISFGEESLTVAATNFDVNFCIY